MEDTDEVKDVKRMYDTILAALRAYEDAMFKAWDGTVDGTLAEKLTLPLLTRDPKSQEIGVNFDAALTKLLKECKYFTFQSKGIPEVAANLYRDAETFRVQTANLTLIQNMYNEMLRKCRRREAAAQGADEGVDKVLDKASRRSCGSRRTRRRTTSSPHVLVQEAHKTLFEMKDNMEAIKAILVKGSPRRS